MAKQVRPTKPVRRKKDWSRVWMAVAVILVIIAGVWYGNSLKDDKPAKLPEAKPSSEGNVDYKQQTGLLHNRVDALLGKMALKAKDIQEQDKEALRSGGGKSPGIAVNSCWRWGLIRASMK